MASTEQMTRHQAEAREEQPSVDGSLQALTAPALTSDQTSATEVSETCERLLITKAPLWITMHWLRGEGARELGISVARELLAAGQPELECSLDLAESGADGSLGQISLRSNTGISVPLLCLTDSTMWHELSMTISRFVSSPAERNGFLTRVELARSSDPETFNQYVILSKESENRLARPDQALQVAEQAVRTLFARYAPDLQGVQLRWVPESRSIAPSE